MRILRLFEVVTRILQAVNFTVADSYCAWKEMKLEMQNFSGFESANNTINQIQEREGYILQNVSTAGVKYKEGF